MTAEDKRGQNGYEKHPDHTRAVGKVVAAYLRANPKCLIEQAAMAGGLLPRRYSLWMAGETEADEAFQVEVMPALLEHASDMVEDAEKDIASGLNGSSAWASWHKFKLERRHPKLFAPSAQQVELTGKDGGPMQHESTDKMSAAALRAEALRLAGAGGSREGDGDE